MGVLESTVTHPGKTFQIWASQPIWLSHWEPLWNSVPGAGLKVEISLISDWFPKSWVEIEKFGQHVSRHSCKLNYVKLRFIHCFQIRYPEECRRHFHILGRGRGPNMYSGVLEPIPLCLVFWAGHGGWLSRWQPGGSWEGLGRWRERAGKRSREGLKYRWNQLRSQLNVSQTSFHSLHRIVARAPPYRLPSPNSTWQPYPHSFSHVHHWCISFHGCCII